MPNIQSKCTFLIIKYAIWPKDCGLSSLELRGSDMFLHDSNSEPHEDPSGSIPDLNPTELLRDELRKP